MERFADGEPYTNSPLKVLWLTDTCSGHRNKALGLLQALARRVPLQVRECPVRWRFSSLRHLLSHGGAFGRHTPLKWVFEAPADIEDADLIVSAGGYTQWPNAVLARRSGLPNIFLGSLRNFEETAFRIVPMPDPPHDRPPYLQVELTPSQVNPQCVTEAARNWFSQQDSQAWTLLVGGSGEGLTWTEPELVLLAEAIVAAAKRCGRMLFVATSPRTLPQGEVAIRRILEGCGSLLAADWYHDRRSKRPPLVAFMGACERIFVTADSVSMTHEAIASGKPAVSIRPPTGSLRRRLIRQNLAQMAKGRLADHQLCSAERIEEAAPEGGWRPLTHDLVDELAERIWKRLQCEFPFAVQAEISNAGVSHAEGRLHR